MGLMGGSLAAAVRGRIKHCEIRGYDVSRSAVRWACRRGWVSHPAGSPHQAVEGADLVVLAAPVSASIRLLEALAPGLSAGAVLTDVCSTKQALVRVAAASGLAGRFVGGHPMCGSSEKGVEHADETIFRKSLCILTPTPATQRDTLRRVKGFWSALGMSVMRLTPAEHDRRVALASHLPQVLATALMASQSKASIAVAGKGLTDTTRLAASDGRLWADILLSNADAVRSAVARLDGELRTLVAALRVGDRRTIERLFSRGQARRADLLRR